MNQARHFAELLRSVDRVSESLSIAITFEDGSQVRLADPKQIERSVKNRHPSQALAFEIHLVTFRTATDRVEFTFLDGSKVTVGIRGVDSVPLGM